MVGLLFEVVVEAVLLLESVIWVAAVSGVVGAVVFEPLELVDEESAGVNVILLAVLSAVFF